MASQIHSTLSAGLSAKRATFCKQLTSARPSRDMAPCMCPDAGMVTFAARRGAGMKTSCPG
eukprot:1699596-Pyramimonas_sp.AAC.1